ncbi:MAG: hypothetical protein Q7S86_00335 [bacterium]|nr:hypothetical protein [bacterium]
METEATGLILICRLPAGQAPHKIRTAWIGLTLNCNPILGYPDNNIEIGVITGTLIQPRIGVSVPQVLALTVLERERPEAAAWWRQRGFPRSGEHFGFAECEIVIISGVRRQRLLCWNEGEGGPYR